MLQVEPHFIANTEPCLPAGESLSICFQWRGVVGFVGGSGPSDPTEVSAPALWTGAPKQWRNTQQAYVTNLLKQLLTLKHRRWRPWEHYTVIESTHALVLAYNDPEERSSQPHLLWSPVIPAIWKLKLSLKASSHRSSFALNCVNK